MSANALRRAKTGDINVIVFPEPAIKESNFIDQLRLHGAADLSSLSRESRLRVINEFLRLHNLRPIEGILDSTKQHIEILGVNKITLDPYVTRIDLLVTLGEKDEQGERITFNHLLLVNRNSYDTSGVIIAPILQCDEAGEEFILLVKTGRVTIGRHLYELPRGFLDSTDQISCNTFGAIIAAAQRELKEELGLDSLIETAHHIHLRELYENTGTHNVKNAVVALVMKISVQQLHYLTSSLSHTDRSNGMSLSIRAVKTQEADSLVSDNHSIVGLSCWRAHKG